MKFIYGFNKFTLGVGFEITFYQGCTVPDGWMVTLNFVGLFVGFDLPKEKR